MSSDSHKLRREIHGLAQSFWPEFKDVWEKNKIYMSVLVVWYGYVRWRDKKSNNPILWMIKSFLKGFDLKFILCLMLGLIVSEIPFVVELLKSGWNFKSATLITPLYTALPALIGMVFLDYLLEPDLDKAILILVTLVMFFIALCGYHCGFVKPNLGGIYIITASVVLLSWCIKVCDRRMIDEDVRHDDAQKVLPHGNDLTTDTAVPDTVRIGDKQIITNRSKE